MRWLATQPAFDWLFGAIVCAIIPIQYCPIHQPRKKNGIYRHIYHASSPALIATLDIVHEDSRQCSRLRSSMPFKRDLAPQNIPLSKQPSKRNPKLKMQTSLEVLDIIYPPQKPKSSGQCHYKRGIKCFIPNIFTLYWKHLPYCSCTCLT